VEIAPHKATRAPRDAGEDRVEGCSTDVVEVHVDPVGTGLVEARADVLGLVVDRRVEPALAREPDARVVGTGDTDDATSLDLRDLRGDRSRRTGCARDDDRLPRLGSTHLEHPEVRGDPGRAEHAHHLASRKPGRDRVDRGISADEGELLPSEQPGRNGPHRERVVARLDDLTDRARAHHLADPDRREMALLLPDPDLLGGIDREEHVAHEVLAVRELGQRLFDELERRVVDHRARALRKAQCSVGPVHRPPV